MIQEYSFGDSNWTLAVALVFGGLALAALLRLAWKFRELPAWQRVLSVILICVSGLIGGLAGRDCATKVAFLRLETEPPRLTFRRKMPGRRRVVTPAELRGIGLLTLGTTLEDEDGGRRQVLLAIEGEREIRSFLSRDRAEALAICQSIAEAFELELQRFAGPPPLKKDAEKH